MLLAVNLGNAVISVGFFDDNAEMVASFQLASDLRKTADEYLSALKVLSAERGVSASIVHGAILASVVPQLTKKWEKVMSDFSGSTPLVVGPGVKSGFSIKIDDPSELGADMVANTAAVIKGKASEMAAIVADLGIVNTLSAISKKGEYLGCVIFPGLELALSSLHHETALLPNINPKISQRVIGRSSQASVSSGVILGTAISIDGFVERFLREMRLSVSETSLIATGEYAPFLLEHSKYSFSYDKDLALRGLCEIYRHNVE